MNAVVHVLSGPAGSGKTTRLRQLWLERARIAPGVALWLGPTRRAVEAVRNEIIREVGSLVGLQMSAFADFLDEVVRCNDSQYRPLSDVQRRLLADDLLAALQSDGRVPHFEHVLEMHGFGDGLLGLLEELQRAGVSPAAFAESAKQSDVKGRHCAAVYAAYVHELRHGRLLDREGRAWHARDLLQQGPCRPVDNVRFIFFDGFTDFTPAQFGVLYQLANRVEEIWISLPDEPGDERAELFTRPRQTLQQLERLVDIQKDICTIPSKVARTRPDGLRHLERQLFRPARRVEVSDDATGLEVIEAPGMLGEVRLVARRVKTLLQEGGSPERIVITTRDLTGYAAVVREVLDEYGIPVDIEGTEPLTRNPAVAILLRAVRLPDDDWPFAGVTALLRHTYFRPRWPETAQKPELPSRAEALLRLLGEPRGREAYLRAVDRWAKEKQAGLEDEQAEEGRRRRTHELAHECGPFLHRFFRAWDDAPGRASIADHTAWLLRFAEDSGISETTVENDRAALALLREELERWQERGSAQPVDRKTFLRRLTTLAGTAGLPRTPHGPGRVRVLSAMQARYLEPDYLFILGLGERGFPRLMPPTSLFDESERQALAPAGLLPAGAADLLPEEMLLFYQVVTRARRQLVLSYPAVDERGQALLPGSFLSTTLACFRPGAVPTERRNMLIEGYDRDTPLSAAEYRVRLAAARRDGVVVNLPGDLGANIAAAAELNRLRLQEREYNPYDGCFRDPAVIADMTEAFGPSHIFSPTALEDYVACPFKFFLRHVLRLEPLEEPREEIEVTRRGQAFHRALARLHQRLKDDAIHGPTDEVATRAQEEIARAVEEDMQRAPSLASQELWRLEGQRLLRQASRYGVQWQRFVEPWLEQGIRPRPHHFEVDFGLPAADGSEPHSPLVIRNGDIEVRVSGRVDRVDIAELPDGSVGFWIIDYKTGRSGHYTSTDLSEFRRLQLTLYALAAEEVLLADREARPLGLAYWLIGEKGPKVALPVRNQVLWLTETERWQSVRETLQEWVTELAMHIRSGIFSLRPRSDDCTATCAFGQICRITQGRLVDKPWRLELPGER